MPDQLTVKLPEVVVAGSAWTELAGGVTSSVFVHVSVLIGALESKTTVAVLLITVPVVSPALGATLKITLPCPETPSVSGGKNPTVGSVGGSPVEGSMEVNVQVSNPV